jgi:hypothetical protein
MGVSVCVCIFESDGGLNRLEDESILGFIKVELIKFWGFVLEHKIDLVSGLDSFIHYEHSIHVHTTHIYIYTHAHTYVSPNKKEMDGGTKEKTLYP